MSAAERSGYWKQERKIEALKADMSELGEVS
jgi:hypothetical protein